MTDIVEIERMGYGFEAIGHLSSGKTVFVEAAAPGDIVQIEIVEEKSSFARARIVSLKEASPIRCNPLCNQVTVCGGCPWAHLSYEYQLEAKAKNVASSLLRTAKFSRERVEELVKPCLASKREWGYRNKLELAAGLNDRGDFILGFHKERTREIVGLGSCPLAHKSIAMAPKALQGALRFAQGSQDLGIFRVGVRSSVRTGDTEIALWTKPGVFPRSHVAKTLKSALKNSSIVRVIANPGKARQVKGVESLDGKGCWQEELLGNTFLTSAPSFFQVNTAQAENLMRTVIDILDEGDSLNGAFVADLYAGGGTFSIPLAKAGADVVAVESAGSSVRDLRRNAEINGVDVEIIGGDAARELPDLGELDVLVVDPPRSGLADGVIESIAAAAPKKAVYVSCDPATWARDVVRFENQGYKLTYVQPVDLFPQTYHVEVVSMFERG